MTETETIHLNDGTQNYCNNDGKAAQDYHETNCVDCSIEFLTEFFSEPVDMLDAQPVHVSEQIYQLQFKWPSTLDLDDPRFVEVDLSEDSVDELKNNLLRVEQGSERVVETQVLVHKGDKTEVWNACYELNYDDEKAYAILENPNSSYPMSESDFSDFQIDNTPFWEFVEFIYDQIDNSHPVHTLVTDIDNMIMSEYNVEEIVDRDDYIYVDSSVSDLFLKIEETIDNYRYPGTDYVLQDVYVIYTEVDLIREPFTDAIVASEVDHIEVAYSSISKYDVTIRKMQMKSRQQLAAVTTIQGHGLYYKNTEYIVFFEPKRNN